MLDFNGKVVIVTGSGSGLGKATALAFARQGADVAVNSLRSETGLAAKQAIEEQTGRKCIYVQGDISRRDAAEELVERTVAEFGRLDILVNNAGRTLCGAIDETSEEEYDDLMRVNVKSAFLMSKFAIPHLRQGGGGAIVHVSSCIALSGQLQRAVYAATKGALFSLTKSMARDCIADNIRVNCVCPGATYTEKMEERFLYEGKGDREAGIEYYNRLQPIGRLGKDSEIATAILFAASEDAGFMIGSPVIIDGGKMA